MQIMSTRAEDIILYPLRVHTEAPRIEDLDAALRQAVDYALSGERGRKLSHGSRIAIAAGSRGIANYVIMLRTVIRILREKGHLPFVFSAMGSHGRGEAEGQREVLDSLGITEEAIGCPVSCSSETVLLKEVDAFGRSLPIFCAKEAMEADGVLVLNRIKPHTSFRGDYESGLLKMLTVGLGRAPGAVSFHSLGAGLLGQAIPLLGRCVLEDAPILGGLGVVENALEQTAQIEGVPAERLLEREPALLERAKALMPRLPVEQADLCIVREMGKNYSGTGMDTNILGRLRIGGVAEPASPRITYIGVLNLSEPSHGNATGIGLADFTTERLVRAMDRKATYLNCLTTGFVTRAAIPMTFRTDLELLEGALQALNCKDVHSLRMIVLNNTLHIDRIWVTEPVYRELRDRNTIELAGEPSAIPLDGQGYWL